MNHLLYGNSYIPDVVTPSSWDTGCHYIRGATTVVDIHI